MTRSCLSLIAVLLHAAAATFVWPQSSGVTAPANWATVTGRVIDSEGHPLAGAKVSIFPLDVAVSGGMPRQPVTDHDGRYRLLTPAYPGKIRLCAVKETAGYPDTQGLLFSSPRDSMPVVSVAPGAVLDNVDIHLGPPDGVLDAIVVDARNGRAIPKARLILRRDEPESMYSATLPSDGHFSFALPPVPIQISVDAPGYRHWTYEDPDRAAPNILVKGSEYKRILIELTPLAGDSQQ